MDTTLTKPAITQAPTWIDYRHLPAAAGGFSDLFSDYLYNFQNVTRFFRSDFRDSNAVRSAMERVQSSLHDRSTLVSVLEEQHASDGGTDKALENIRLLASPTTYAVVTGQQVGLFGGPLYTVFKAITAIRLAESLNGKHPGFHFVPVFWLEAEDHDFNEVNHIGVLNRNGLSERIDYLPDGEPVERNMGPVGEIVFDKSLDETMSRLRAALRETEFSDGVIEMVRNAYAPGKTFRSSFVSWMNTLFDRDGLVFLSSNHRRLKSLLSPLFVRELLEYPMTSQLVIQRSAELEEGYHAQTKAKSVNLFMFHRGGRYLIEPRENDFSLRGTRHFVPKDEMIEIARNTPELLSTNVVLRPVAQDMVLPTIAYIGGPSEIAYLAQLGPVYDHFGVAQPVVFPRVSASFFEERVDRLTAKYGVSFQQLIEDPDGTTKEILRQIAGVNIDGLFDEAERGISDVLGQLEYALNDIDPTLLGSLKGTRSKMEGNVKVLRDKAFAAQRRRNETAVRQIERGINAILPNGKLQERELNVVYYLNRYGPDLVQWLTSELEITAFKHQVLTL